MNFKQFRQLHPHAGGFTLVELLIVVIILSILAAIVVPQFSSSANDAKLSALDSNLATMRSAVELYYQQHGHYPSARTAAGGVQPTGGTAGTGAVDTALAFNSQMSLYTNANGETSTVSEPATYKYGPYLKKGIPIEPVSNSATVELVLTPGLGMVATAASVGWKYNNKDGQLIANTTALQGR